MWYRRGKELKDEIRQTRLPAFLLAVWYIGQMGVVVKWNDKVICFDPILNDLKWPNGESRRNYESPFEAGERWDVDYVICTHGHADHMNLETLLPLAATNPKIKFIVPEPERQRLNLEGIPADRLLGVRAGDRINLEEGMSLYAVAAAHEIYQTDAEGNHKNLGYILDCGGLRLYHGGDTMVTEKLLNDMSAFVPVSIACLPINGTDFERRGRGIIGNMNYREAAFFAKRIEADLTIPLHYDMVKGNEENPLTFASYMQTFFPNKKYHIMRLGERMIYG